MGKTRRIGRYELYATLASGGMATVHLAGYSGAGGFKKLVAFKRIHRHLVAEEGFVEMFLDEARVASRIHHPNVCEVLDFGIADGNYFLVMELLTGEPLAKVAANLAGASSGTPPDLPLIGRIIADAARGLHAAHTAVGDDGAPLRVVHRDVSPSNVFITFDGVVKIMDFGIASAADQLHLTTTGTLKGTIAYMAPEQLEQSSNVDHRADVWALGVLLWELVAGRRLFRRRRQVETMRAVLDMEIPPPSSLDPTLPPSLDAIVLAALSRDVQTRIATADELATRLDDLALEEGWTTSAQHLSRKLRASSRESLAAQTDMIAKARAGELAIAVDPDEEDDDATREASLPAEEQPRTVTMDIPAERAPAPFAVRAGLAALVGLLGIVALTAYGLLKDPSGVGDPGDPGGDPPSVQPPETVADVVPGLPASTHLHDTGTEPVTVVDDAPPTDAAAPSALPQDGRASADPGAPPNDPSRPDRPALRRGFLHITTPGGWAEVRVGGRPRGTTPLRLRTRAGRTRVELRPFGHGSIRRSVVVPPNGVTRLVVPVQRP